MTSGRPSFRGRDGELDELCGHLGQITQGAPRVALIEGEPGIGKTRLLEEVAARAADAGFTTLFGTADELDTSPFTAFASALRSAGQSAGVPTAATEGPPEGAMQRSIDALLDAVERYTLPSPVLLILDDMQWADAGTLAAVSSLSRRMSSLPLALVLAARRFDQPRELARLADKLDRQDGRHLHLRALPSDAVRELAGDVAGGSLAPGLVAQIERAGGNPMWVIELVRAAGTIAPGERLPESLRATILRRFSFLDSPTLDVLRTASVLGATFSTADVITVTGRPLEAVLAATEEAAAAGIVEEHGDLLRFRHPLIREALYDEIPPGARRLLHVDAGRRLLEAGTSPVTAAHQLALGAQPGDVAAARELGLLGRSIAEQYPGEGAQLLERAIELLDEHEDREEWMRIVAASLLPSLWLRRMQTVRQRARRLLALDPPPSIAIEAHRALLATAGWPPLEGVTIADADVAVAMCADQPAALVKTLTTRSQLRRWSGDARWADDHRRAIELAEAVPDAPFLLPEVLLAHALGAGSSGGGTAVAGRAVVLARAGRDRLPGPEGDRVLAHALETHARALFQAGRVTDAEVEIRQAQRLFERLGLESWVGIPRLLGMIQLATGDWDGAINDLSFLLEVSRLDPEAWDGDGYQWLIYMALHQNRLDDAASLLAAGRAQSALVPEAGLSAAFDLLDDLVDAARAGRPLTELPSPAAARGRASDFVVDVVVGAAEAGDRAALEALAQQVAVPTGAALPYALLGPAALALANDDHASLASLLDDLRRLGLVSTLAQLGSVLAPALARAGDRQGAEQLFAECAAHFEAMGARRDLARLQSAMRASGLRSGARGTRSRPATGWEALTPAEREVATLAADGLTNPEIGERLFVSRRTVQTHLGHVFTKLGIASRRELRGVVSALGADAVSQPTR